MAEKIKRPLTDEEKKARGKKIRRIVIPVVLLAAAGIIGYNVYSANSAAKAAGVAVEVAEVRKGDIEQIVTTSGTVDSDNYRSYYANIQAQITELNVREGDTVKAGDQLVRYDIEKLDLEAKQQELTQQRADGNYSDSLEKNAKSEEKLAKGTADLPVLEQQIQETQDRIDDYQKKIEAKKTRMAQTALELEKTMLDINQNGQSDANDGANPKDENGKEISLQLQESLKDVNFAQQNDPEIAGWNAQINSLNEILSKLKEQKSEAQSDKSAGESGTLTSGGKQALAAENALQTLNTEDSRKQRAEAEKGVVSDFDGIVTEVKASKGMVTQMGTELLTVKDLSAVKATINITKYDLDKIREGQKVDVTTNGYDYQGTVSRISHIASKNSQGATVVTADVTIDNADDNVILGSEANLTIHTKKDENALLLPIEAVNTDRVGDFVYVVEEGNVVRRNVKTGIMSDEDIEILEGVQEGDQVILEVTDQITEGVKVNPTLAQEDTEEEAGAEEAAEAQIVIGG